VATKTISVDLEAYERLCAARTRPQESFSMVIKRARWPASKKTARALRERLEHLDPIAADVLDQLEANQADDSPPEDQWRRG
jgi:predicted CopG family antitoxin